jgi:hypothetical protein
MSVSKQMYGLFQVCSIQSYIITAHHSPLCIATTRKRRKMETDAIHRLGVACWSLTAVSAVLLLLRLYAKLAGRRALS